MTEHHIPRTQPSDIEEGNESIRSFEFLCPDSGCDFGGTREAVLDHILVEHPDSDLEPIKNEVYDVTKDSIYEKIFNGKKPTNDKGGIDKKDRLSVAYEKRDIIKAFSEKLTIREQFEVCIKNIETYPNNNISLNGEDTINTLYTYYLRIIEKFNLDGYVERDFIHTLSLRLEFKKEIPIIIASKNLIKACALVFALKYKNIYSNLLDPILGSYKKHSANYSAALKSLTRLGFLNPIAANDSRYHDERQRIIRALRSSRRSNSYNDRKTGWYIIEEEGEEETKKYIPQLMEMLPDEIRKRLSSENPLKLIVGRTHEEVEKQAQKREFDAKKTNLRIQEIEKEVNVALYLLHKPKIDFDKEIVNRLVVRKIKPPYPPQIRLEIAEEILKEAKGNE